MGQIMRKILRAAMFSGLFLAGTANAAVVVSVEAPGVQHTTTSLTSSAVETFDGFTSGYKGSIATFGTGGLQATYSNTFVFDANLYGGAGGTGEYNYVQGVSTLDITSGTANYFGLWASAIDHSNVVSFFKNGTNVGSVDIGAYALSSLYNGNPTANFLGNDGQEGFAFFNFKVAGGFDQVLLNGTNSGGFENDNQTLGTFATSTPAPEPASWMLMIAGFGAVGFCLRRPKFAIA
jgi:hypothetical protein